MRIKLLILSIIVSAGFTFAADSVLFGNVLETDWILTPEGVTNAILTTALTVESDPLAYHVATNALALAEGALQADATNGMLTAESDPVALPVAEAALGFATNALPKTGGEVSGFIIASGFQTLPDPDLGLTSLFTPRFITLGYDSALGPLGPGVLNIRQDRIEGVNSYGKLWKLYYPTNHPTATFATLDDIPDVSDLATKSEVDVVSNWVESIRGVHADIATNITYHVVVSNGHWLIREVN